LYDTTSSFSPQILVDNTDTSFGYSYILAWVGVFFGFLEALVLVCEAFKMKSQEAEDAQVLNPMDDYTLSSKNARFQQELAMQNYMAQQAGYGYPAYSYGYPTMGYPKSGSVYGQGEYGPSYFDYHSYKA
jgi:hypothetical protein